MKTTRSAVPGLNRRARNPKFIRGIPRLVVPKKIPKSAEIVNSTITRNADHVQSEDLSNSGYHSSAFAPNRGTKPRKTSFGDF